jgi:hypothetical protein
LDKVQRVKELFHNFRAKKKPLERASLEGLIGELSLSCVSPLRGGLLQDCTDIRASVRKRVSFALSPICRRLVGCCDGISF